MLKIKWWQVIRLLSKFHSLIKMTLFCEFRKKSIVYAFIFISINSHLYSQYEEPGSLLILDFNRAVQRVLQQSTQLQLVQNQIETKCAEKQQLSLYPNPIFSYEVENIFGNKDWRGFKGNESRYALTQLFELGGKRELRQRIASYQYYAALVQYEISQIRVLNDLAKSFIDTIAAQEYLRLVLERKKMAEEMLAIIQLKVENGKASCVQHIKAELTYHALKLEEEQAWTAFEVAKKKLAFLWGDSCPDFTAVSYPFYEIESPSCFQHYWREFCHKPELVRAHLDYLTAHEMVNLEKSQKIPDVNVTIGCKTDQEVHERGFLFGIAFPLPVFDRNQGNIRRAYTEVSRKEIEKKQVELILHSKLNIAYQEFVQAYQEADKINQMILKAANQLYACTKEGYEEGKFEYVEVLEAQHLYLEQKEKYIEALLHYHEKKADLDYLTIEID